ncbi:MAG: hypothetical protein NXH83_18960 [Rhodobacteraceae bacterium]|nr:hypothetical protein [Paracoccaceae bacterium]
MLARALSLRIVFLAVLAAVLAGLGAGAGPARAAEIPVFVFWQEGCPHCGRAKDTLAAIAAEAPGIRIVEIELGASDRDDAVFDATLAALGIDRAAVPLVVVGGDHAIGFSQGGISEARYREMIARCREVPCVDVVGPLLAGTASSSAGPAPGSGQAPLPGRIALPWIGPVETGALSLPLLTLVLAAVDGFNPCALWVLALLIGLLIGTKEARRMWILGGVFLAMTGVMYFAVMAAWLNVVLWLGAVGWIRIAIGALAVGAGLYYLREYWTNPEGVCRITAGARRRTVSQSMRALVEQPNLAVAALGIAALAVAVNLVELACSAGLPAIYTQALAMHDLPGAAHYGYLVLYIAVFLLDDTLLFVVAMVTLRAVTTTGRFARVSHLVGGAVLLALGVVMILRPDLLG